MIIEETESQQTVYPKPRQQEKWDEDDLDIIKFAQDRFDSNSIAGLPLKPGEKREEKGWFGTQIGKFKVKVA